jgi:hypothetical protein
LPNISATGNHVPVGNGARSHRLLEQPVKQQSLGTGRSSIESEHELVQVVVQLAGLHRSMVGAHHPALQQGRHPVQAASTNPLLQGAHWTLRPNNGDRRLSYPVEMSGSRTMNDLTLVRFCAMLCLVLTCGMLWAAPSLSARFDKVNDPALNGATVTHMLQDQRGFMWIATGSGLYRYDGYASISVKNAPGVATSLPSHDVTAIFEDHRANLWIGTTNVYSVSVISGQNPANTTTI